MEYFQIINLLFILFFFLFVPGFALLKSITEPDEKFPAIENLVLSFGLSIAVIDLFMILMNFFHLPINRLSLSCTLITATLAFFGIFKLRKKRLSSSHSPAAKNLKEEAPLQSLHYFSYRQILAFLIFFGFAVMIRTVYVAQGALPQTTDLGHHMYWAKHITTFEKLPNYEDAIIEKEDVGKFIIGEHLVFAAIGTLSGIDYVSAMPVVILLVINCISLLAFFLLAFYTTQVPFNSHLAKKIALLSLLCLGVLYGISAPQAKYVSGGVIGNIMGNLFMPLFLYAFLRTITSTFLNKKNSQAQLFAFLSVIFGLILAYTHHLTSFVLLFVLSFWILGSFICLFLINAGKIKKTLSEILTVIKPFFATKALISILAAVLFFLYIMPPSYLNSTAIDTAIGTPVKATRIGLPLESIFETTGKWRFILSISGIIFLAATTCKMIYYNSNLNKIITKKNQLQNAPPFPANIIPAAVASIAFPVAWFGILFIMSNRPTWLKIDIPSGRISNYITLPAALLSAIAIGLLLEKSQQLKTRTITAAASIFILGTGFLSGMTDISSSARDEKNPKEIIQVYEAANYLSKITAPEEIILKDHIYLAADSWMKLYLMRGYKNPLSRSFLKRYDDPLKTRETCTRDMIAAPDNEIGQQCYLETNVKYVVLKPGNDTAQFDNSPHFSKIFSTNNAVVFMRHIK
jgi:hypothetical protein